MKRKLILVLSIFLVFSFFASAGFALNLNKFLNEKFSWITGHVTASACADSDSTQGLLDIESQAYIKGNVKSDANSYTDYCSNSENVAEYFCNEDKSAGTTFFECENGCKDGVCSCKKNEECPKEYECKTGACEKKIKTDNQSQSQTQVCVSGTKRCSGDSLEQCNSQGTDWAVTQVCQYGCDPNTLSCKANPQQQNININTNKQEERKIEKQICGNSKVEEKEECDGTNLKGKSCKEFGYDKGTLKCANCKLNFSLCEKKKTEEKKSAASAISKTVSNVQNWFANIFKSKR